ncbi:MAG TPA: efflux RND transporter permease subunit, partial [Vicinamibacterales bacterium]
MSRFFVGRPIVAIVIAIVTVLGGLVAMQALPIAQFPEIIPPQISVTATYTGADALTIEQSVAAPLEQQMNGVDNMLYMLSTNSNDGTMTLTVTFDVATDPNIDQVNVQNRIAQAQPNLPPDVNTFGLTMRKSTGFPMMIISLISPKNTYDSLFLANYANINLIDALYRVPGVGEVRIFGAGDYAMRIWVKPDMLAKLGLTVPDLVKAVQQQSTVNPAGQVGAQPSPSGQEMTYTVRAQGRLQTSEEFGDIAVRANPDGSIVRLKDVARVELGALNYQQIGRVNAGQGCGIGVFQAPGSNALQVAGAVKKVMADLSQRFPQDLDYRFTIDTTLPVSEGIREILITLGEALLLVIFVVYLFLQNWRATLIPMVAVPVSLIGTFAVFPLLGFSINTLSLFGLVLAIGLVVDDAIVVVEAVEHHIEEGMAPRDATLQAMREVSGPVVSIALILASVFIPVGFMSGIQGRLNKQFALTIAISVIISAFNALTLSPALAAMLLRPRKTINWFFSMFNRGFERATHAYVSASHGLVRKAFLGIAVLLAFTAFAVLLGRTLPTSFVPEEDYGYCLLNVQLPPAASLERTDAVCRKIDQVLAHTNGIENFNTIAGFSLLSRVTASNYAFYFIGFKPWDARGAGLDARSIVNRINGELRKAAPEATAFAVMPPSIPGLGTQGGFSFWLQDRSGGSIEFLNQNLQKFLEAARRRPELTSVTSQFTANVPEMYANVDRDKVLKQGVALGDVYQTMQAFLGGVFVNQFNRFG